MLITIGSAKCIGIQAMPVIVEVTIDSGIGVHLVGLADAAVKESLLRTMTALQSLGFKIPGKKIVINLAPADLHKRGSGYDVPIALGIVAASQQMSMPSLEKYIILGELGLDGTLRSVAGALPTVEMAAQMGYEGCILPALSALEALEYPGIKVYGAFNFTDVLKVVCNRPDKDQLLVGNIARSSGLDIYSAENSQISLIPHDIMDFSEIVGQETAKRGLEIAAAGGHNVILVGPPGSGKSSLAKAMCGILPPMTQEESLQTSKIYSVSGTCGHHTGLIRTRPFRSPHYSVSIPALVGGGSDWIVPGEISMSHNGILFLDELCEIPKRTIEALRSPMEDRRVVISRLKSKVVFPASFTLVAATNPCPCGYYGEGDRCTCTVGARRNYLAKLSGPLMDRIDIQLWLHPVQTSKLVRRAEQEPTSSIAARVQAAREIQKRRFEHDDIFSNAQMNNRQMHAYCPLSPECSEFLEKTVEKMGLSARACSRIIKIARTIADLDAVSSGLPGNETPIAVAHLAEAVSYRFLDKTNQSL